MEQIRIGTVIKDMGRIGLIKGLVDYGTLIKTHPMVKWRINYEIYYHDGGVGYLGIESLQRMISYGLIEVIFTPEEA